MNWSHAMSPYVVGLYIGFVVGWGFSIVAKFLLDDKPRPGESPLGDPEGEE